MFKEEIIKKLLKKHSKKIFKTCDGALKFKYGIIVIEIKQSNCHPVGRTLLVEKHWFRLYDILLLFRFFFFINLLKKKKLIFYFIFFYFLLICSSSHQQCVNRKENTTKTV